MTAQNARIAVISPPMLLVLAALSTAHAAESTGTLTLACKGTNIVEYEATHKKVSSQVTMGIIVDFQKKTVVGFTPGSDIPVMIKDVDETSISFEGHALNVIISGTIDRVTGTVVASIINGETSTDSLELQCKPTQRMF
jgi:archaellum component FlaG (FlaF/FlaG flagellin family)